MTTRRRLLFVLMMAVVIGLLVGALCSLLSMNIMLSGG